LDESTFLNKFKLPSVPQGWERGAPFLGVGSEVGQTIIRVAGGGVGWFIL